MQLRPDPAISPSHIAAGKRALVRDAAWASLCGSLYGGVVLVAFAVALGAGPFTLGVLAAVPLISQASQLFGIALVERVRQRRKIVIVSVMIARTFILVLAFLPFVPYGGLHIPLLVTAQVAISALGSISGCALNSWLHQFLPAEGLGAFFAKRLFWATTIACVGTLVAGQVIDHLPVSNRLYAYAPVFAASALAGFISARYLVTVPEPQMKDAGPPATVFAKLRAPLADPNFRSLLVFMGSWHFAANVAAPFLTVYLLRQLGYSLGTVTTLWVTSQVANALTLYLWGKLSDRFTNKAVLAVALPAYFACMLGLVFTPDPQKHDWTLPLLYLVHLAMGAAAGGIGLATGNIGLKLAPQGQGTAYLAAISLVASIAGGVAPMLAGALAEWFQATELSVIVRWVSPNRREDVALAQFAHWEFLFAISSLLGLYVLHALSRVREGHEVSERLVIQQFALEAVRTVNSLSSISGIVSGIFAFGRLAERRLRPRPSTAPP
jgi:MFS family permease